MRVGAAVERHCHVGGDAGGGATKSVSHAWRDGWRLAVNGFWVWFLSFLEKD